MILSVIVVIAIFGLGQVSATASDCRCMPGDDCWPSHGTWEALNATVGGRLIATVPIGSVCHDPTFDDEACAELRASWIQPLTHIKSPSSIMQTLFTNNTCDPFTERLAPCEVGNYASYAVDVRDASDVSAVVKFAGKNRIRLVIKNTGHDALGRSTGAGALSIWTQSLKNISFSTRQSNDYTGPIATFGAGVLGYEAVHAAHAHNLTVVTGECPTVGVAGGFTQGGGHSALSTAFGLAADQTIEFEVVTASGDIVIASTSQNRDLYWALSGGGGGTFGIVTSMTVRAHPNLHVGGAGFLLLANKTSSVDFAAAASILNTHLPRMVKQGAMVVYSMRAEYLAVRSVLVWNSTAEYVREVIMAPYIEDLEKRSIAIQVKYSTLSYRDHYETYLGPLPEGILPVGNHQGGGRLLPKNTLEDDPEAFSAVLSNLVAGGNVNAIVSVGNYSKRYLDIDNAVLPAWRESIAHINILALFNASGPSSSKDMLSAKDRVTLDYMPQLSAAIPRGAVYMNEADMNEPDWKRLFFGEKYSKLLEIKKTWDKEDLLYVYKGVGSDTWKVDEHGRMCRS